MCTTFLIAMLGTTTPGHVIKVPASKLAGYTAAQIDWAKSCARDNGVRWRVVKWKRR